ncbi:hypothetical protein [Micromonospora avicenniae]|uniref:hypothetical protein n=1 Tax=Micromonospora avicenniae TaxID=1198245 RepID=UPI00333418F6
MSLLLLLNELSYQEVKARREEVSEALTALVELLRRIRQYRRDVSLVTEAGFFDLVIGDGYSLREWAGDGRNRDRVRVIRGMGNRAPFRAVMADDEGSDAEYFHEGRPAAGLGAAHLLAGLALSLRLAACWDTTELTIIRRRLVDDGALVDDEVEVRHACSPDHVPGHRQWFVESALARIHTPAALWEAREDIFPHLRFLPRVAEDLNALPSAGWFDPVKERLAELEKSAADWRGDPSVPLQWQSHITPDSDTRKELSRFTDLDGASYLFDWHARFTPGAGRLHFRIDKENHMLVVAYIGRKL